VYIHRNKRTLFQAKFLIYMVYSLTIKLGFFWEGGEDAKKVGVGLQC